MMFKSKVSSPPKEPKQPAFNPLVGALSLPKNSTTPNRDTAPRFEFRAPYLGPFSQHRLDDLCRIHTIGDGKEADRAGLACAMRAPAEYSLHAALGL